MPRSSIDKRVYNMRVAPAGPTHASQSNWGDFLPKYEQTLNSNLRNFGDPEAQHGHLPLSDGTQEPAVAHSLSKKRRALIVGSLLALVIIVGTLVASLLSAKLGSVKQQSPLSTRATDSQYGQTTSTAFAASISQSTESVDTPMSVVSATTLITTTVAGPSSQMYTSYVTVTVTPQTIGSLAISPPVISATTFITRTAAGVSSELFTSYTTVSSNQQPTFFSYSPEATSTATTTATTPVSVLQANESAEQSIASALSSLEAHATPSPITSRHTHIVPSEKLPSPPTGTTTPATTSSGAIAGLPSLTSAATPMPSGGWINYCGVPGSSCGE
ncbi:hypothetical protein LTR91_007502 [Friedmanniomyces endolithicus]|uniref:Uncharacterized protein n=1 Tax=Friedmanniomyces endolithicus TaxID=329885 RepID=A0AAN6QW59_9PEZI|nr:hypothetical protein LTR57_012789 [Friedmanniomyces endolithicus]KAK0967875.1 hypothetical protein LTS01_017042 [Friedmanniomyces endolithicus]KAK0994895.1 hypothetical protein LTR91_007502 [Friedmanniomyces endolithicus]KAK1032054.1 hypothetical protein LTS16_017488 [Friedmanniomyces endolithicus]